MQMKQAMFWISLMALLSIGLNFVAWLFDVWTILHNRTMAIAGMVLLVVLFPLQAVRE